MSAAHGATDRTVVHLEDFLVGIEHNLVIDADFAEFVLDDGAALTGLASQDVIEQGGLAGSQQSSEYGDGYLFVAGHAAPLGGLLSG